MLALKLRSIDPRTLDRQTPVLGALTDEHADTYQVVRQLIDEARALAARDQAGADGEDPDAG